MAGKLKIWLWLSVVMALAGAVLLFPIGTAPLNVLFVLIKAGMVTGLLLLLLMRKKAGFYVWSAFCVGAVVMTVLKGSLAGSVSFLLVASIAADILMPAVAYALIKREPDGFQ